MMFVKKNLEVPIEFIEDISSAYEELIELDDTKNVSLGGFISRRKIHNRSTKLSSALKKIKVVCKNDKVEIVDIDISKPKKVYIKQKKIIFVHILIDPRNTLFHLIIIPLTHRRS